MWDSGGGFENLQADCSISSPQHIALKAYLDEVLEVLESVLLKAGLGTLGPLRLQAPASLEERGSVPADSLGLAEAGHCTQCARSVHAFCRFHCAAFGSPSPLSSYSPGLRTRVGAA